VSPQMTYSKVPGDDRKAGTKSLILFTAGSLRASSLQSPAESRKAQRLRACKVPQGYDRKVHPYGGRPSVPPPVGLGLSPRCFGVAGKAEVQGSTAQRVQTNGIPHQPISADWR
jgi:hypothetical protein